MKKNVKITISKFRAVKEFAVTGIEHGSIVQCRTGKEAIEIFKKFYNNEKVIKIKIVDFPIYGEDKPIG